MASGIYRDRSFGFSETPSSLAFDRTASSVRCSVRAMVGVGVFVRASAARVATSLGVQVVPVLLAMMVCSSSLSLPLVGDCQPDNLGQ